MAAKLHHAVSGCLPVPGGQGRFARSMNRESQTRFIAILLFLLTVAAVVFAWPNFQSERKVTAPDDGVKWVE